MIEQDGKQERNGGGVKEGIVGAAEKVRDALDKARRKGIKGGTEALHAEIGKEGVASVERQEPPAAADTEEVGHEVKRTEGEDAPPHRLQGETEGEDAFNGRLPEAEEEAATEAAAAEEGKGEEFAPRFKARRTEKVSAVHATEGHCAEHHCGEAPSVIP